MSGEAEKIAVAIVDDEPDARILLRDILDSSDSMKCVGAFSSGEAALAGMELVMPEVVLMDIRLPGMSGIECARRLKGLLPGVIILFVSRLVDWGTIFQAVGVGCDDFLAKPFSAKQCLVSIVCAWLRGRVSCRESTGEENTDASLTAREEELMDLQRIGLEYKEIADRLNISQSTVNNHLAHVREKLRVHNAIEAINKLYPRGG
jgi:DNA-binding NarL/FixJ family response regulator